MISLPPVGWRLRASSRLLWWRRTLPFQLAHGPLCERHRENVFQVGSVYVCRSCALLYGAALALTVAIVTGSLDPPSALMLVGLLALPVISLSYPPLYRSASRGRKDLLRAFAGALLGLTVGATLRGAVLPGGAMLLLILLLFFFYARLRRRARGALCAGCPELGRGTVCSGYALQADRIRRFEDEWSAVLTRQFAGGPPDPASWPHGGPDGPLVDQDRAE